MYPLCSPLLLSALCSSNWGSSIVGSAISDASRLCEKLLKGKKHLQLVTILLREMVTLPDLSLYQVRLEH